MNSAEKIVDQFFGDNPDGQKWPDGFEEALELAAVKPPYHPGGADLSNSIVYEFADGSNVVESNGAWDFGYTGCDCGCWVSEPHRCRTVVCACCRGITAEIPEGEDIPAEWLCADCVEGIRVDAICSAREDA